MMKKLWNTNLGKTITFAKLRASYAITGNSLPRYSLYNVYGINKGSNQNITAGRYSKVKFNPNLVAELIKTFETGINLRFFNRIDIDANYFTTPMPPTSSLPYR